MDRAFTLLDATIADLEARYEDLTLPRLPGAVSEVNAMLPGLINEALALKLQERYSSSRFSAEHVVNPKPFTHRQAAYLISSGVAHPHQRALGVSIVRQHVTHRNPISCTAEIPNCHFYDEVHVLVAPVFSRFVPTLFETTELCLKGLDHWLCDFVISTLGSLEIGLARKIYGRLRRVFEAKLRGDLAEKLWLGISDGTNCIYFVDRTAIRTAFSAIDQSRSNTPLLLSHLFTTNLDFSKSLASRAAASDGPVDEDILDSEYHGDELDYTAAEERLYCPGAIPRKRIPITLVSILKESTYWLTVIFPTAWKSQIAPIVLEHRSSLAREFKEGNTRLESLFEKLVRIDHMLRQSDVATLTEEDGSGYRFFHDLGYDAEQQRVKLKGQTESLAVRLTGQANVLFRVCFEELRQRAQKEGDEYVVLIRTSRLARCLDNAEADDRTVNKNLTTAFKAMKDRLGGVGPYLSYRKERGIPKFRISYRRNVASDS